MKGMSDKRDLSPSTARKAGVTIDSFLKEVGRVQPVATGTAPRLIFALDATMSRQPTWDLACRVQGEMFETASAIGGLQVQLAYFRGFDECRSSRWVADPRALTRLMSQIECRGGHTQIARVLRHARTEAGRAPLRVLVFVGDAMEEPVDDLCALAGELGILGVKAFMFHEGHDPAAAQAFQEMARLTGGAYARFDAAAPGALAELLKAAAAYATRGREGLSRLASTSGEARRLLQSLEGGAR